MNVFIVVTNGDGNVVDSKGIVIEPDVNARELSILVDQARGAFAKQYTEPKYSIHVGVGDNLVSVLRSFPEIRQPKLAV